MEVYKPTTKEERLQAWIPQAVYYTKKERSTKVTPKPGEIYAVDMGVNVGSEINGIRPCIILSSTNFNVKSGTFPIVPITGHDFAKPGQLLITEDLLQEGTVHGVAKIEMVTTISKGRVGNYIGRLNDKGRHLLAKKLCRFFSPLHKKTFVHSFKTPKSLKIKKKLLPL